MLQVQGVDLGLSNLSDTKHENGAPAFLRQGKQKATPKRQTSLTDPA